MPVILLFLMLFSANVLAADIELTWTAPTEREDGTQLESIDSYSIYTSIDNIVQPVISVAGTETSYVLADVAKGSYIFQISTVSGGTESDLSNPINVTISDSKPVKIEITVRVIE